MICFEAVYIGGSPSTASSGQLYLIIHHICAKLVDGMVLVSSFKGIQSMKGILCIYTSANKVFLVGKEESTCPSVSLLNRQ